MKEKINIFILIGIFYSITSLNDYSAWRDYPTCRVGRLQSPINFKETDSTYSKDFSFVYQNYIDFGFTISDSNTDLDYAIVSKAPTRNGGYINFERGGVIKQYELLRFEIYPPLHHIDGDQGDYELHLVHKKNLDFNTNKNQYRSIQDANMYLIVVLRYRTACSKEKPCTSDNGLLDQIFKNEVNLNDFPIFQDKRAYLYEGSSLHIPCDENVNYYIVKDFFYTNRDFDFRFTGENIGNANRFDRPIYKNFMNYREVMKSNYISNHILILFLLIIILF